VEAGHRVSSRAFLRRWLRRYDHADGGWLLAPLHYEADGWSHGDAWGYLLLSHRNIVLRAAVRRGRHFRV